ncbi:DNA polymerase epsilon subunit 3 [Exaiptasia diaphana]|uniref:DNA polymerase epsilon subunit 3 n=1 Tax=Exaiptasia diaphana TaxID=2652724 RepID=A0A913Y6G3_EXADI|nr:DNA polymerase epsilon subunit 3 [Exaiptasia diaphana]KXJ19657.1 DNA polymerase epsilon subunit 3 [Exaiptasia diaphana]
MAEKVEDLSLPTAVMVRLVKDALPDGVNIAKEARAAISKAASVFVLYATTCANTIAVSAKRKTLTASDVFQALEEMEFEEFIPKLKEDLIAFKREQKGKKEAAAESKRRKSELQSSEDSAPEAKKQKTDDSNEDTKENDDSIDES